MSTNRLTETETRDLLARVRAGDRSAETVLVERNLSLVYHIANHQCGIGADDLDDAKADGMIGLLRAIRTFDLDHLNKDGEPVLFQTWAGYQIRRAIKDPRRCNHRPKTLCWHRRDVASLDKPTDEGGTMMDFLSAPGDAYVQVNAVVDVAPYLAALTPRQRQVVELRYGLTGRPPMTLREAGARLGMTFQAVDYHERNAMARMRKLAA
jgi:RNA polymerase sporulation-specific sigma factor